MHALGITGDHAKTKADLRALHLETEQTHIPHVVKALWGEAHKVQHVVDLLRNMQTTADLLRNMQTTADLLRNMQTTGTFARPVAHILSYMASHSKDASFVMSGPALQCTLVFLLHDYLDRHSQTMIYNATGL